MLVLSEKLLLKMPRVPAVGICGMQEVQLAPRQFP